MTRLSSTLDILLDCESVLRHLDSDRMHYPIVRLAISLLCHYNGNVSLSVELIRLDSASQCQNRNVLIETGKPKLNYVNDIHLIYLGIMRRKNKAPNILFVKHVSTWLGIMMLGI